MHIDLQYLRNLMVNLSPGIKTLVKPVLNRYITHKLLKKIHLKPQRYDLFEDGFAVLSICVKY